MTTIPSTNRPIAENYREKVVIIDNQAVTTQKSPETPSTLPEPIFSILRWVADKLAKYQTPVAPTPAPFINTSDLIFPALESQPVINLDSHVAKLGFSLDEGRASLSINFPDSRETEATPIVKKINLEELSDRELVVWIAKYLSGQIHQVSQAALLKTKREDYLLEKIDSATPAFRQKTETAVYNLLKTIAKQTALSEEVSLLARQLVILANQAKFSSCQVYIDQFINEGIGLNQPREDFRVTQIPPFDLGNIAAVSAALGVSPMPSGQFYLPSLGQTLIPPAQPGQTNVSSRRLLAARTSLSSLVNLQDDLVENPVITITSIDEIQSQPKHNYRHPPVSDFYQKNISNLNPKRRR